MRRHASQCAVQRLGEPSAQTSRMKYRDAKEQPGINFPISVSTPPRTKALVPTRRVGTVFVPLRGALDVNRTKALVPTRRVGKVFVPLRGALGVNRRKLFPTCS